VRLTILHTNDIHGRIDGIARVATLVERICAETEWPVIYMDAVAAGYRFCARNLDISDEGMRATVIPVTEDIPLHPRVVAETAAAERDAEAMLGEVIGELAVPLDQAAAASWLAEILRERMDAGDGGTLRRNTRIKPLRRRMPPRTRRRSRGSSPSS
jgi:2',3'-cyclic-nucleotide 2'-phosphodiesterase (5'-nucleotidase family)